MGAQDVGNAPSVRWRVCELEASRIAFRLAQVTPGGLFNVVWCPEVGGGGDPYMKGVGMLAVNFELNP